MLRITDTAAGSAWHELLRDRSAEAIERGVDIYTPATVASELFVIATGSEVRPPPRLTSSVATSQPSVASSFSA